MPEEPKRTRTLEDDVNRIFDYTEKTFGGPYVAWRSGPFAGRAPAWVGGHPAPRPTEVKREGAFCAALITLSLRRLGLPLPIPADPEWEGGLLDYVNDYIDTLGSAEPYRQGMTVNPGDLFLVRYSGPGRRGGYMRRIVAMLSAMMMVVLAAGVAFAAEVDCTTDPCLGTRGNDEIHGTENSDTIRALAGDDFVFSALGDDTIYLDNGKDRADGGGGNDTIYGGAGSDRYLAGAEDSDTVYGGKGNDVINAAAFDTPLENLETQPVDYSYGDSGNDTIDAEDGNVDYIDCGEGRKDTVYYDVGIDTVTNCEVLNPPRTTPPV